MERFVANQNIARFQALLAGELDSRQRQIVSDLLAREREKLNALDLSCLDNAHRQAS
ncbi:hypothetical protein [Flavisphingomonas formosensis]|uniref:hypothetical protein n=1 Tax=Flavisphingomonas formosensis TaxID=861534 RepID=UPI0012F739FB|nr:hypothetical protein [Sphingomonas formosensis]